MPSSAGFVLVGGRSSRMGCDKALLPYRGAALAQYVARELERAAGQVALVGDPARYGHLGYPVVRDLAPGAGPLGGICSALRSSAAAWNLVLACDMPGVKAALLARLLAEAERGEQDCLLPAGPSGRPEPLCGVYHQRCLPVLGAALARGVRKIMDGLAGTRVRILAIRDEGVFDNCNTPEEWAAHADKTPGGGI
ncbi:MAG TPA: molybdenum cofactor guanylyltransferase [Bryobacteraceae bacterium]|nr:molybdenum cofactor guanylyltransferase [Bryobacteraceae bacterium]